MAVSQDNSFSMQKFDNFLNFNKHSVKFLLQYNYLKTINYLLNILSFSLKLNDPKLRIFLIVILISIMRIYLVSCRGNFKVSLVALDTAIDDYLVG